MNLPMSFEFKGRQRQIDPSFVGGCVDDHRDVTVLVKRRDGQSVDGCHVNCVSPAGFGEKAHAFGAIHCTE
jgi:hypothetical protein